MSERKVSGIIADEITAAKQTQAALDDLMGISKDSHKFIYETMTIEKDGKLIEIEVPIDDIDLLDDVDTDDLTEEGERSLGIIDADFDTTENKTPIKRDRNGMAVVDAVMDSKEGKLNIVCPYTGSSDVYHINSNTWASYETDEPFKVRINMMDEED